MSDVVIVGAGPAGSSLAMRLACAGYDVTLLERSRFPRAKVCGDYLSTGALHALKALGVADDVLAGAHPIHSVSLHGYGEHIRLPLPGDAAVSLARSLLDERLLTCARAAGATLCLGVFLRAHEDGSKLRITYRDEHGYERQGEARVLVGADGAWSSVARQMDMAGQSRPSGPWAVGGELPLARAGDELSMYVGPKGYYARNPLSDDRINTMLVAPTAVRRADADTVVEQITDGALRFEADKIARPVATGPLRYRCARVAKGRVLLTGDAAELLDPFTGQGVATALALSVPAADAVTGLMRGLRPAAVARSYAAQWHSVVKPRRSLTRLIETLIRSAFLRARALRGINRDRSLAHGLLAGASGHQPAHLALSPSVLLRLLAS